MTASTSSSAGAMRGRAYDALYLERAQNLKLALTTRGVAAARIVIPGSARPE